MEANKRALLIAARVINALREDFKRSRQKSYSKKEILKILEGAIKILQE